MLGRLHLHPPPPSVIISPPSRALYATKHMPSRALRAIERHLSARHPIPVHHLRYAPSQPILGLSTHIQYTKQIELYLLSLPRGVSRSLLLCFPPSVYLSRARSRVLSDTLPSSDCCFFICSACFFFLRASSFCLPPLRAAQSASSTLLYSTLVSQQPARLRPRTKLLQHLFTLCSLNHSSLLVVCVPSVFF